MRGSWEVRGQDTQKSGDGRIEDERIERYREKYGSEQKCRGKERCEGDIRADVRGGAGLWLLQNPLFQKPY